MGSFLLYPKQVEALPAKVRVMLRPEQVYDPEHLSLMNMQAETRKVANIRQGGLKEE